MSTIIPIPGISEPVSSLTHLFGALVFAAASLVLLRRGRGDAARMASLLVFSLAVVLLLTISGVYHMLAPDSNARAIVRRMDHVAIFILIASTFTPALTILFRGWRRRGGLLVIWAVAVVGIALKMVYFHEMPQWVGLGLYLGMGWLGVFSSVSLWRRYGFDFVQPIIWGGLAYTFGCLLEGLRWPVLISGVVQPHELFHVAVLIGLGFHWAFTFHIADGRVLVPETTAAKST